MHHATQQTAPRRHTTGPRAWTLLAVCAATCWAPTPWLAFPAAFMLALVLPGMFIVTRWSLLDALRGRTWLALSTSVVVVPIVLDWAWRLSNTRLTIFGAITLLNAAVLLFPRPRRISARTAQASEPPAHSIARTLLLVLVGTMTFASLWLPEVGDRFAPRPAHDYVKHHAVLWSLEHHPLPLHSPFYAVERDTPYYYYHYHHLLPAAVRKLCGDDVSIGFAFGLTSALVAMCVVAMTYFLAVGLLGAGGWGPLLAAACVSLVGGWDAVAVAIRMLLGSAPVVILDSWCPTPWRIHNLMTQYMWCPQHLAALLALLLGVQLLQVAPRSRGWILAAPILGASIFGSSVYLAMSFFAAAAIYVGLELGRNRSRIRSLIAALVPICIIGLLLMGLQAIEYARMNNRAPGGLTTQWARPETAFLGQVLPPGPLANLLDAPWMILVDLGLPAIAMLFVAGTLWKRIWANAGMRLLLIAGVLGTFAPYTVRSSHSPFDYSFRVAIMPLQILAALLAGALLNPQHVRRRLRPLCVPIVIAGVLLGLPVGLYEAPVMAIRSQLEPSPHRAETGALRYLRDNTPQSATILAAPGTRFTLPQLVDRPLAIGDPNNSHVRVFYPRDMQRMRELYVDARRAFATSSSTESARVARRLGATHILIGAIEYSEYGVLSQYDDDAYFEAVYTDEHARVVRLVSDTERAPPTESASPEVDPGTEQQP